MAQPESATDWLDEFKAERLVRYSELRPCTTAFIDTRTPGSAEKENFTIIGPGVAESPDQHIHISIPHGFNIGGARQPPGCLNSQHSHETAEVFVVHSGTWAFLLGPNKEDGEVVLGPGDTISIPVHVFRGFKNVGDDTGFLFAVLGGDDPGHVTWAPYVFDNAKEYGLVLLEDGSLVDTTVGETIPEGKKPMAPTTEADVAALRKLKAEEMTDCVVSHPELREASAAGGIPGLGEVPIIGEASSVENIGAGKMQWSHGFNLRFVAVEPGAASKQHARHEEEVIFVHKGELAVRLPGGDLTLVPGDTLTVPIDMPRVFANEGSDIVEAYFVRGGDHPRPATVSQ
ncbi:MAG: cupin domain-containing protein [Woeseiaceae bacterium]|nr:cupin domain-containing protein [Woeseiaceae bacterium]